MGILLALAPFIVFAVIDRVAGPVAGLSQVHCRFDTSRTRLAGCRSFREAPRYWHCDIVRRSRGLFFARQTDVVRDRRQTLRGQWIAPDHFGLDCRRSSLHDAIRARAGKSGLWSSWDFGD